MVTYEISKHKHVHGDESLLRDQGYSWQAKLIGIKRPDEEIILCKQLNRSFNEAIEEGTTVEEYIRREGQIYYDAIGFKNLDVLARNLIEKLKVHRKFIQEIGFVASKTQPQSKIDLFRQGEIERIRGDGVVGETDIEELTDRFSFYWRQRFSSGYLLEDFPEK